jgi:hypothetical protein
MPALNEHAFAHGPPIEATAGMWTIQRVHLALGQRIYRFGSSTSPDLWYAGAWWLRYEDYLKIRRSAETGETSLGYAARRFLALRYEWGGNVDVLVSGIVSPPAGCLRWARSGAGPVFPETASTGGVRVASSRGRDAIVRSRPGRPLAQGRARRALGHQPTGHPVRAARIHSEPRVSVARTTLAAHTGGDPELTCR